MRASVVVARTNSNRFNCLDEAGWSWESSLGERRGVFLNFLAEDGLVFYPIGVWGSSVQGRFYSQDAGMWQPRRRVWVVVRFCRAVVSCFAGPMENDYCSSKGKNDSIIFLKKKTVTRFLVKDREKALVVKYFLPPSSITRFLYCSQ